MAAADSHLCRYRAARCAAALGRPAVHVRLRAVLDAVGACGDLASSVRTDAAQTVRRCIAGQSVSAGSAEAAAIGVELALILHVIEACRLACPSRAHPACTVARNGARRPLLTRPILDPAEPCDLATRAQRE